MEKVHIVIDLQKKTFKKRHSKNDVAKSGQHLGNPIAQIPGEEK